MNVHKNARMTFHGRLLMVQRVREAGWRVADAAAGVSDRTEWLYGKPYANSAERADDMTAWLHWYNHHRPHAGIRAATPAS